AALASRAGGSERLKDMGGIAFRAPVLAAMFLIVALATLAMPGSSNFVGEFMILLGLFKSKLAIAVIAFAGVAGAAFYALRLLPGRTVRQRVLPALTIALMLVAIGLEIWRLHHPASIISGALRIDDLALELDMLFSTAAIATVLLSLRVPAPRQAGQGEYYAL